METQLEITTTLSGDKKVIMAKVLSGFLPRHIFIYENVSGTLGDYYGVCNREELTRLSKWEGLIGAGMTFGNRFVRSDVLMKSIDATEDESEIIAVITKDVQALSTELQTNPSVTKLVKIS